LISIERSAFFVDIFLDKKLDKTPDKRQAERRLFMKVQTVLETTCLDKNGDNYKDIVIGSWPDKVHASEEPQNR
jgi:hypothetical protein